MLVRWLQLVKNRPVESGIAAGPVYAARRAVKRDGVSLNQFINTALAEKVAVLETEDVLTRRAALADKARFLEVLDRIGPQSPRAGDELD